MKYRIHLIGTSHVSKDSVQEVRRFIKEENPDVVAVELDPKRTYALFNETKSKMSFKMIKVIGLKGFVFYAIARFVQNKVGKILRIQPGSEMKTAIIEGLKNKKQVVLIDQDVRETLRRLSEEITWKERLKFLRDAVRNPLSPELKKIDIDLSRTPSKKLILIVVGYLKKEYPSIYKVLIEERNRKMVSALSGILKRDPDAKIVAVVGAGHEEGMKSLLRKKKLL